MSGFLKVLISWDWPQSELPRDGRDLIPADPCAGTRIDLVIYLLFSTCNRCRPSLRCSPCFFHAQHLYHITTLHGYLFREIFVRAPRRRPSCAVSCRVVPCVQLSGRFVKVTKSENGYPSERSEKHSSFGHSRCRRRRSYGSPEQWAARELVERDS